MYEKYYFAIVRLCDWFRVSTFASGFNHSLFIRSYSQLEIPMSISANFPNVFPSLELNFAQSQQLDPRVTFSRSTTAPYYDGKTSVLAEQNLVLQSQNAFNGANWTKTSCTATDASTIAPDGTTTASTLTGTAGGYTQYISPTNATSLGISSASTVTNTYSLHLKAGTISSVKFLIYNNTGGNQIFGTFDLTAITGVAGGTAMTPTVTIVDVGNSWRRVTVTGNLGGSVGQFAIPVIYADNGTFYMWGIQVEQRSSVTAYNATTTSAITNYIPQLLTAPINQPRFDFNPTTGESLGLLIEQSSTNLQPYSQDFSNAVWTKSNATITTGANIAPDGTQTMQLLVENTTTAQHYLRADAFTLISGTQYTTTIYAKANGRTTLGICCAFDSNGANFNLSNGTVGTVSGGATATITPVGNGVYRCSMTRTPTSNTVIVFQLNGNASSYTGDGYSGIYIWGAQLEALAFPTSYIPTTSAQVTRASDRNGGLSTNGWYNNGQGTFYFDFKSIYSSSLSPATTLIALGNVNTVLYTNNGGNGIYSYDGVSASSQASIPFGTRLQLAISYGVAGKQLLYNGGTVATSTYNNAFANQTNLYIGNDINGFTQINGWIKKMAYYPQQLTVAQNQALTGS